VKFDKLEAFRQLQGDPFAGLQSNSCKVRQSPLDPLSELAVGEALERGIDKLQRHLIRGSLDVTG
jgi:hypothetical protein